MNESDRRISEEVYLDAYQKFRGLQSEFLTLKDRWSFASQILENDDILPDIFNKGGIDHAIRFYSKYFEGSDNGSYSPENCNIVISDLHYGLENIAQIVSLIKSGFFQRTDSMDLPYVIAGIPLSPERSWGNELYLVAADKLVQNYLNYLNIPGYKWDKFVSWDESKGKSPLLTGGGCIHFRRTFHLLLSMDIKYNFEGFLVLPHELAHAVSRAVVDNKRGNTYWITANALRYTRSGIKKIARRILNCKGWEICPFRKWVTLKDAVSEDEFFKTARKCKFTMLVEESLMDIIAVHLGGTSYISGLANIAFKLPVRRSYPGSADLIWNEDFFTGVYLRLALLLSYLQTESGETKLDPEYLHEAERVFGSLQFESNYILDFIAETDRRMKRRASYSKCMTCVNDLAFLLGKMFALHEKDILKNRDISVFSKSPVFATDERVIQDLLSGKTCVDIEPRLLLDSACKGSRRIANMTCPAALYSLAFNQQAS